MKPGILSIDLGTSSVKLLWFCENEIQSVSEKYTEISPDGWFDAVCKAMKRLSPAGVRAIGLSSQVGTYIVDDKYVVSWNDPVGQNELEETLGRHTQAEYIAEISMPHPKILSYPLPRLRYIIGKFGIQKSVMQPKDMLIKRLCGTARTDKYSWRGLCNLETGKYSEKLLSELGLDSSVFPEISDPTEIAGRTTEQLSKLCGLPAGTPVYTGCNDFFAAICSMGIVSSGSLFDITGTSEHLGVVSDVPPDESTPLVSGPYFSGYAVYGVTASSGRSLDLALSLDSLTKDQLYEKYSPSLPIFLPYLNGERAPIFDQNARGVFFGMGADCDKTSLCVSIAEGVVFSLWHIYETLGRPQADRIAVTGGASKSEALNILKATLFDKPVYPCVQKDASAYGAAMLAAVGCGDYLSLGEAAADCRYKEAIMPEKRFQSLMYQRFEIYRSLYPTLKKQFDKAEEIRNNFERK